MTRVVSGRRSLSTVFSLVNRMYRQAKFSLSCKIMSKKLGYIFLNGKIKERFTENVWVILRIKSPWLKKSISKQTSFFGFFIA